MESKRKSSACSLIVDWMNRVLFHRIQSGSEPVDHHVDRVRPDLIGFRVVACERMPVGYEVIAFIIAVILKGNPVRKRTVKIAQMELSRGSHPAQYPFSCQVFLL